MDRHTFTQEETARGGSTPSLYKSLARSLANRRICSPTCVFFDKCPVCAMSFGSPTKTCLMKEFPQSVRQQFVDLFLTGEEGIITAIKKALHNYMNDVDAYGTLKDKRDMVQLMLTFYDKVYNNPRKAATKKEPLTITVRRVGIAPQVITAMPHESMAITARDIINPANEDITEDDPESLLHSDKLVEIMRPVTRPLPGMMLEEIKIESNMEEILDDD